MGSVTYDLSFSRETTDGTSNLSYLLDDEHREFIRTFTPPMVENIFGPGDESCDIPSKGYTDPEWYWKASDGKVWGIGWRWGSPRLRGKGSRNGQSFSHPCKFTAFEFVEFLRVSFGR